MQDIAEHFTTAGMKPHLKELFTALSSPNNVIGQILANAFPAGLADAVFGRLTVKRVDSYYSSRLPDIGNNVQFIRQRITSPYCTQVIKLEVERTYTYNRAPMGVRQYYWDDTIVVSISIENPAIDELYSYMRKVKFDVKVPHNTMPLDVLFNKYIPHEFDAGGARHLELWKSRVRYYVVLREKLAVYSPF